MSVDILRLPNPAPGRHTQPVHLLPGDTVDYMGATFTVTGMVTYRLPQGAHWLARLEGTETPLFVELPGNPATGRILVLTEIPPLDINTPPPTTIYDGDESYLLHLSGTADVTVTGEVPGADGSRCTLWRYRAAGDRYLQIEAWPNHVRMLAGATVHESMIEVRPVRL